VWGPLLLLLGYAILWPLISLETQASSGLRDYVAAYTAPGTIRMLQTTVALAVLATTFAFFAGLALAWASTRLPRRVAPVLQILPMTPLLIPAVAGVTGWAFLLSPRVGYLNEVLRMLPPLRGNLEGPFNAYSFGGVVFVSGLLLTSFMYLFLYNGLQAGSGALDEAAAVSGASPLRTFLTVTLPQLRPSIVYGVGITLLLGLGQFAAPLLLGVPGNVEVLTTRIFGLLQAYPIPFGQAAALGAPLLVSGMLILIAQRVAIGDMRRYSFIGGRTFAQPRPAAWWSVPVVGVYGLLAVVLPLLALTYVALSPYWTGTIRFDRLTLRNVVQLGANEHLSSAIFNSLVSAGLTLLIVLPVGYLVARFLAGRAEAPRTVVRALDLLALLPYGTPAILFGFSLLFAYTRPPFILYGSYALIIVAFATIMVPYSVRLQLATLLAAGEEPWEAARVSGASPLRVFMTVTIPLMRRGVASAAAIIFVLLFQEFGVALTVRTSSIQVVGTVLYDVYTAGTYPSVAVLALAMVSITAVGVGFALSIGGGDALARTGQVK
jgi:iron(III) transport system permease protein